MKTVWLVLKAIWGWVSGILFLPIFVIAFLPTLWRNAQRENEWKEYKRFHPEESLE